MMVFARSLASWLRFDLDRSVMEAETTWHDFGTGVRLGKLGRENGTSLVLYDVAEGADEAAFEHHRHPGGEAYLVLEGEVVDEHGRYGTGSVVWMAPGSTHSPRTVGRTLILVLWPEGVELDSSSLDHGA